MGIWSSVRSAFSNTSRTVADMSKSAGRSVIEKGRESQQLVFQQLVLQFESVRQPPARPGGDPAAPLPPPQNPGAYAALEQLIEKGRREPLSWLELYNMESMIIRVLDDASLASEAWSVREEFRNLATEELFKAYTDSHPPPGPDAPRPSPEHVRAEVESLLRKLHELRIGRSLLDVIRAYTTTLTLGVTLLLIFATILVAFIEAAHG